MQVFRLEETFDPLAVLESKALEYADHTRLDVKNYVEAWYEEGKSRSPRQRVMAIVGPAGYGKSVIMAFLAMEGGLISRKGRSSILSFLKSFTQKLFGIRKNSATSQKTFIVGAAHSFKHDDTNGSSARVCFLSVANQLAVTVPGVKEELLKLNLSEIESISDLKVLFRSLLCAPMMRVKTPDHPIIVLLDALDEVNVDEKEQLVEIITTMWESETPQWLGVMVSSRPGIKNNFENTLMLQLRSEENLTDLYVFLVQRLERYIKWEDIEYAVEIVLQQCDDFFLYASFLDKMLQERKRHSLTWCSLTLRDMRTLTKEFPRGLEEVYREYFSRFLQGALQNNYDQYQRLLSPMVAARSPLDVEIVSALLELESQEVEVFFARAEHLLLVEEGKVRFVHKSMNIFLQDKKLAGRVAEKEPFVGVKSLSVSVNMGHKQLVEVLKANPTSPFALEHLIYHLCKRKEWGEVRDHLLDFDWVHAAVSISGVARRLIHDTDALYNYESFSDVNVTDVIRAVELGRSDIERDPNSLVPQLLGRIADRSHPILTSLAASDFAKSCLAASVYCPIRPSLEPARSPLRKILEGHSDHVNAVAVDGSTVVSGSFDQTVRVWDRRSGECLQVLKGHSGSVKAVAIDGDTVVSGSWDKTVRLWDRVSGECLQVLKKHSINGVAIDGSTVVSGSNDETVRVWDRRSGECLQVLKGHSDSVKAVAIDGDTVVSGSFDTTVRLWDQRSGECLHVLEGHSSTVRAVAIDGDIVMSGSSDKTVRLWDRASGECLRVLEDHSGQVLAVAIDGETVVSRSWDNSVRLWDRRSGECFQVLEGHSDSVNAVAIDGNTVVSGSKDNTVRLWDRLSDEYLQVLESHSHAIYAVAMDGDIVVSSSFDTTVRLWDQRSGECLQMLEGHSCTVRAVAIDGDTVVSGSDDNTVRLWDRRSAKCLQVLEGHSGYVFAVAIDGDTVVSGSDDKTVRVWNRLSGICLQVLQGHSSTVRAVAIDGDTVVSGSYEEKVRLWDRRSGEVHLLEGYVYSAHAVFICGDTVVSGCWDSSVRLWDRWSGECLQVLQGHSRMVHAVAIDGETVVSGSMDKTVRLWDRRSGACLQVLRISCRFCEVAVGKVEGRISIVCVDENSKVPHILVPFSTQFFY